MINERIEELKKRITAYINAGGDIYAPKRKLPYYEYLSSTVKAIKRKTGKDISFEDVYKMCGVNFSREYNHFRKFLAELTPFVENGYADAIRTKEGRTTSNVYSMLKNYAEKYNTTPFDFLVLMTGYKFEECYIKTDYIENLKAELLVAYPNKDITGIRWENPQLYEKLRQIQKFLPEINSVKAAATHLGFTTRNMLGIYSGKKDEQLVVKELTKLYPNKNVVSLYSEHPELYYKVLRCCRENNKSTTEWFKGYGFTYSSGQKQPRLSKTKVDGEARAEMLLNLKRLALEKIDYNKTDEISRFEANIKATKAVIELLNNQQFETDIDGQSVK